MARQADSSAARPLSHDRRQPRPGIDRRRRHRRLVHRALRAPVVPADGRRRRSSGSRRSRSSTMRMVQTESPRGRILDRNGNVLVENARSGRSRSIARSSKDTRARVIGQLAEALAPQYTAEQLERTQRPAPDPAQARDRRRRCARDRPGSPSSSTSRTIPGTKVQKLDGAALSAGSARRARARVRRRDQRRRNCTRHDARATKRARRSVRTASSATFEKELRGKPRREKVEVDPTGQPVGAPLDVDPGTIGNDVKLTIDASSQGAAEARAGAGHRARRAATERRTSRTSASRT